MSAPCRVILLLDLDCFYAQCERVRLGLDPDTPLALLQWNSALAVTYPARGLYQIKRGDSWDAIREKSNGQCFALHLPLLTNHTNSTVEEDDSVEQAYERVYCLSNEEQARVRSEELGVQRYNHEGKACLERYRLASSRIFSTVLQALTDQLGAQNFVLERASIDELFLDVTNYCWNSDYSEANDSNIAEGMRETMNTTVVVGEPKDDDPDVHKALERGCLVAHNVRKAVFDALGFTLSAGCSTSKLVAKLGASYGKPNGQAVIFPSAIPHVMNETEIRKVRNLGGKIGKQVQALLPDSEKTTMGSIAQLLSLPVLCDKLGQATGKMVFDACRGMDEEPVKETVGALVKSITAFKSFTKTSITSGELTEWILLLAKDVVARVHMDAMRNSRYPKICTVQYAFSRESPLEGTGRTTRSVRIPFPRGGEDMQATLAESAKAAVVAKEGKVFLCRIGLCASDFQPRLKHGGISSFFVTKNGSATKEPNSAQTNKVDSAVLCSQDEELARKLQAQYKANLDNVKTTTNEQKGASLSVPRSQAAVVVDRDMELARKLQASYDREDYVLGAAEKRPRKEPNASSKRLRIDNFFQKG